MPSYPRITQIQNIFTAQQTFDHYIVINGIKVRPTLTRSGSDVIPALEYEVDGVWKTIHSVTNPVPA